MARRFSFNQISFNSVTCHWVMPHWGTFSGFSRCVVAIALGLTPLACAVSGAAVQAEGNAAAIPATPEYNRDIRPILAENCLACHGPDSASRKADLRLDIRDAAIEMSAIVPGEPDASELIDRIFRGEDDELAMPPIDGHKRLTTEQRETLKRWVSQGAKYEPHWSLIPPQRPDLPAVNNTTWARNPVDKFVLAKLEEVGLNPNPEADRRTLARRLALDLTGLPPTPESVEAFVTDTAPDYYEKYVDQLLDSVRWGEHRGRYWLDYARYADTHGIHFDNFREMWAYRDWVINAFNQNQPFDQFTIEQLAGDLLPNPSLDQIIATGFNRCNITTNEGGIIDEEYKVLYARDRTETTSAVWLGLTTGCAVCHDHKFDAVTMKDFYAMSAFFNNTTQPVRDGNVHNTPPIVPVPRLEDRARFNELPAVIAAAKQTMDEKRSAARSRFNDELPSLSPSTIFDAFPGDQQLLQIPLSEGAGPAIQSLSAGRLNQTIATSNLKWAAGHTSPNSLEISTEAILALPNQGDFERDQAFSVSAWIWLPNDNMGGSILARMDEADQHRGWDVWLEGGRLGSHIINRWPDNALKVVAEPALPKQRWTHITVSYDGSSKQQGLRLFADGKELTQRNVQKDTLSETIKTSVPLKLGSRNNSAQTAGIRLNDVRLFGATLTEQQVQSLAQGARIAYLLALPSANRDAQAADELFAWWLRDSAPEFQEAEIQHSQLVAELEAIKTRGTIAHVMNEAKDEAHAFMLNRGEYDQRGDKVTADTPVSLPPMDPSLPKNRLGLAKWLLTEEHPLTTRVTVNRFWQEVFGSGLVSTAGDFGIMGNLPTHPELLDFLAVEFRESGWDVKQLFKMMVTSATYRQASTVTPEKLAVDADNAMFSRGPRFRMDAEMIRDKALFVSDLISARIGGPSVKPYQPEGVWEAVAMPGSNTRDYRSDSGESLYRRSLYTFWKRSAPPASMEILNAPNREVCTVQRERTNTPLQALVTLNDPQFIEAARHLATAALQSASEPVVRIQFIAFKVLSRPLEPIELDVVESSLQKLTSIYSERQADAVALIQVGQSPPNSELDPKELAAWTMLCNQLMNLDEALNK